ncbi:F-box protein CPR1-like [Camellia sinensis]|uniref:F-box protein CPR1-like n=1 Tax=Camellia sinensis TaxID=4442 RepID=UPI0010365B66|nr:F-box protein CPR1-like [Camellia sinensis]
MSDYIPRELLIDILTRLPAETLVRFTLVCKSWYSLITSPSFISHHLNRTISNPNSTHLLLRYCTEDPIQQEHYSLRCDDPLVAAMYCYNHKMFLWNPLIRKSVSIPYPNVRFGSHGPFMHSLGFGFDSISNDFKVVRIVHIGLDCNRVPPEVELYTLKTGIWRNISDKALPYIVVERSRQAYINGVSHWVAHTPRYGHGGIFRNLIVSFNMNDEVFGEISFPEGIAGEDKWMQKMSLLVFGETLCLIQHCKSYGETPHCSIWMMKQYGVADSWVRQIKIDLSGGFFRKPIGMRKNGEVLGMREGYLVSYDPESKRIIYLGVQGTIDSDCWYSFDVDTYKESLVLLDKGADFSDEVISDRFCAKKVKRTDRTQDLK